MRFGLVLAPAPDGSLSPLAHQASQAELLGFDLVWVEERHTGEDDAVPDPFLTVAAVGAATSTIRLGVTVDAGAHPVTLAEELAVADVCTGGRLVVAVRSDDAELLAETLDVLLAAQAARPFRHRGARWAIPANLAANAAASERAVRVTPLPAQLEVPLWTAGPIGMAPALARGLTHLGGDDDRVDDLASAWEIAEGQLGPAVARLRRPCGRRVAAEGGSVDGRSLVEELLEHRRRWGLDTVLLRLPEPLDDTVRGRALRTIAAEVWPRVQLDRLPPGLDEFWQQLHHPAANPIPSTSTEPQP